ncbi:hypothetical protein Aph02nite_92380 [Actinoplanes philippinensis]|uniref:Uncharacterized protein n=1 Tax=Actinoplanes philippinensis TaxID=35752 RepID=A0A1I2MUU9_9ACTN|nr:hypothetical protein [Actinoplanes philippinensis]GIE83288.1 hypothetical protein Aph02nite_92380 [Actinoplanes philippinensis]SFF95324.1 hypothetical protein SAMN05421541_13438 [Actinoplanes philippinensis]
MTITPRGTGGTATTRTARNRNRRRNAAAATGEPRHAAPAQPELAPPRRRGGRHAAEEPLADDTSVTDAAVAGTSAADVSDIDSAVTGLPVDDASVDDVEFPAPAWDPWAAGTRQALSPGAPHHPHGFAGSGDHRNFLADAEGRDHRAYLNDGEGRDHRAYLNGEADPDHWAHLNADNDEADPDHRAYLNDAERYARRGGPVGAGWGDSAAEPVAWGGGRAGAEVEGLPERATGWDGGGGAGHVAWMDQTGSWVNVAGTGHAPVESPAAGWIDGEVAGWGDSVGTGLGRRNGWADAGSHGDDWALHTGVGIGAVGDWTDGSGSPAGYAETAGAPAVHGETAGAVSGWAGPSVSRDGAADGVVEGLWLALDEPDDSAGGPGGEEASCEDAAGRGPYRRRGVPEARKAGRRHIGRWSHARRTRSAYLNNALVRCGLYLGALSVAVSAAEPLGRVAWPVPAVMVLLGWTAAQGLTSIGVTVAGRGGPAAAARTVGAGFAAVIGLWCSLVWIAPDALLGPDRLLAATVGIGGLATLATVTAALVTRAEGVIAGWYAPCWLLAAAVLADAGGVREAALVPVQTLLPAAMVAVGIRAFRPALLPRRAASGRRSRLTAADRRRAAAYLIIGAAQAISVILLWRGGPAVMPLPAALPLLVAVPLLEGLIGWHTDRIDAGLDAAETPEELDRHIRNVTAITLAGLLPPLAAGCGLLVAAYRLPYGFSLVPGAREAVLALAAATLLGGVFAVTFLLAARTRHGIAATLATIPPLAATVLALSAPPAGLLPAAVAVLAATHLAGLLIVALTAADLRRTP